MTDDLTDRTLTGWNDARPDLEVGALKVTARLSRIGPHLARRQEAVFGRFGLNRGEVGALSALRIAGPPHRLSPTRLGRGLMLSSAGVTSRIDRLERGGLVRRLPHPPHPPGGDEPDRSSRAARPRPTTTRSRRPPWGDRRAHRRGREAGRRRGRCGGRER